MDKAESLKLAIAAAGSMSKLARACGVKPQSVRKWVLRGEIPVKRCRQVEKATGVSRKKLRPDFFA